MEISDLLREAINDDGNCDYMLEDAYFVDNDEDSILKTNSDQHFHQNSYCENEMTDYSTPNQSFNDVNHYKVLFFK